MQISNTKYNLKACSDSRDETCKQTCKHTLTLNAYSLKAEGKACTWCRTNYINMIMLPQLLTSLKTPLQHNL